MSTAPDPYVATNPGDLITAQLFNGIQSTIRQDIADKIGKAVSEIKTVEHADDATKLGGKTAKELEDEIIQKALAILPTRTGYKMIFKRLTKDDEKVIKHDLKAFPLVDVYQLDYFKVVCARSEEKEDQGVVFVNFYLYHSSEKRLRTQLAPPDNTIDIELTDGKHHPFKIPFATMLDLAGVKYTDTQSLGDLETEFWQAFFSGLNDEFDQDQYCHSPWFERCCGEQRSVATLKQRGDWDDIWFQMRPRKAVHFLASPAPAAPPSLNQIPSALADVQVVHFDFDTMGVQLLADPTYPTDLVPGGEVQPKVNQNELKVMLLLKV
jgi:hypothetical protein